MFDGDGAPLEVNGIPFEANQLTSAQAVESSHQYRKLHPGALEYFKNLLELLCVQKFGLKLVLSRAVHLGGHILYDQVGFQSIFQRLMDDGMVVKHRIRLDCFQPFSIKLLNMPCL